MSGDFEDLSKFTNISVDDFDIDLEEEGNFEDSNIEDEITLDEFDTSDTIEDSTEYEPAYEETSKQDEFSFDFGEEETVSADTEDFDDDFDDVSIKNELMHSSYKEPDITSMYVDRKINEFGGLVEKSDTGTFEFKHIAISNIAAGQNRIRKMYSLEKLALSIQNEGLLCPIVVAPTKTEGLYIVVDGLRRLLACAQAGLKEVPCIINNSVSVPEISIVEALCNLSKTYTVKEMLDYIDFLKKEKGIASAPIIEHLMNMESGDYNKLMDVIEDDDTEIVTPLLAGQISIQQAFKKLEQKRKKIGKDEQDAARAAKVYGNVEEYGMDKVQNSGETSDFEGLTDDEVRSIVDSVGNLDDIDGEDGESLRSEGDSLDGFQPNKQDPNDRERLDPKLRKAVLARDDNKCMICEQIKGQEYTEVLDVHHIVEVYLGGNDDMDNLITACTCCHKLVHLWGRGELHVRPFEEMDELEARKFKRIIKLGNIIRKGTINKGMRREELKKLDKAETIGRRLRGSSDQVAG